MTGIELAATFVSVLAVLSIAAFALDVWTGYVIDREQDRDNHVADVLDLANGDHADDFAEWTKEMAA